VMSDSSTLPQAVWGSTRVSWSSRVPSVCVVLLSFSTSGGGIRRWRTDLLKGIWGEIGRPRPTEDHIIDLAGAKGLCAGSKQILLYGLPRTKQVPRGCRQGAHARGRWVRRGWVGNVGVACCKEFCTCPGVKLLLIGLGGGKRTGGCLWATW